MDGVQFCACGWLRHTLGSRVNDESCLSRVSFDLGLSDICCLSSAFRSFTSAPFDQHVAFLMHSRSNVVTNMVISHFSGALFSELEMPRLISF